MLLSVRWNAGRRPPRPPARDACAAELELSVDEGLPFLYAKE